MNTYCAKENIPGPSKYGEISSGYFEDRKSKFYCYIFSINNSNDALNYINDIKQDNKDARHVVYIYSVLEDKNLKVKFSDDGEPQGTGTRAIYDILTKNSITNVCIVIVRYFGGILLGAGPLSRAYLNAFRDATKGIKEVLHLEYVDCLITVNYPNFDKINQMLDGYINENIVRIKNIKYNDNVEMSLEIEEKSYDTIVNQLSSIL